MINLMFCCNQKVFDGLIISLLSITKNTKEQIHVYLLTMDLKNIKEDYKAITEKERLILEQILKNANQKSEIKLIDITDIFNNEMLNSINFDSSYTPYIFLRLLIDKVENLPDKILYLDADIVCYKDISELYKINIEKYEIAAGLDYFGRWFINPKYLNSGVLLINLKKLKETNALKKVREMCVNKKMLLPDQTALNKCCRQKLILPRKFNEQKRRKSNTIIRHFSMTIKFFPYFHTLNIKPWEIDKIHNIYKVNDYDDILEKYIKIKETYKGE